MSNKIYFIDIGGIKEDYHNLHDSLGRKYNLQGRINERVLDEVVRLHLLGVLHSRTYHMFNPIDDDWQMAIIDILHPDDLERHLAAISAFNDDYKCIKGDVVKMLTDMINENNPGFTIWEVDIVGDIAAVEVCGDYRIERWHDDYGVSKSNHSEVVTVDLDLFIYQIRKRIRYDELPGKIKGVMRSELLQRFIINFVGYCIGEKPKDLTQAEYDLEDLLEGGSMGVSADALVSDFRSYFDYEIRPRIEQLSNNSNIHSYVITNHSVAIHYGKNRNTRSNSRHLRERSELAIAEANMDYIPERLRR